MWFSCLRSKVVHTHSKNKQTKNPVVLKVHNGNLKAFLSLNPQFLHSTTWRYQLLQVIIYPLRERDTCRYIVCLKMQVYSMFYKLICGFVFYLVYIARSGQLHPDIFSSFFLLYVTIQLYGYIMLL